MEHIHVKTTMSRMLEIKLLLLLFTFKIASNGCLSMQIVGTQQHTCGHHAVSTHNRMKVQQNEGL